MSEWKRMVTDGVFEMHHPGWRGLWDHFVALVTGKDQQTVPTPITFSVWAKSEGCDVRLEIIQEQVETGDFDE